MVLRFVKGLERAVSGCGQSLDDSVYLLIESVHSPYCQLLVKYHSMETQLLRHQLHSVQLVHVCERGTERGVRERGGGGKVDGGRVGENSEKRN